VGYSPLLWTVHLHSWLNTVKHSGKASDDNMISFSDSRFQETYRNNGKRYFSVVCLCRLPRIKAGDNSGRS